MNNMMHINIQLVQKVMMYIEQQNTYNPAFNTIALSDSKNVKPMVYWSSVSLAISVFEKNKEFHKIYLVKCTYIN